MSTEDCLINQFLYHMLNLLNLEQNPQLFNKESLIHKAPSQQDQYLVQVKDHKFHIIDQFQEETKVLEL